MPIINRLLSVFCFAMFVVNPALAICSFPDQPIKFGNLTEVVLQSAPTPVLPTGAGNLAVIISGEDDDDDDCKDQF